jgi:hypothetical protein
MSRVFLLPGRFEKIRQGCPKCALSFVVKLNTEKEHQLFKPSTYIMKVRFGPPQMSYPYSELYFDVQRAKEQFAKLWQSRPDEHTDNFFPPITNSVPLAKPDERRR